MANNTNQTTQSTQNQTKPADHNLADRQKEAAEEYPQKDQDMATEIRDEAARNHMAEQAASPHPKDELDEEEQSDEERLGSNTKS